MSQPQAPTPYVSREDYLEAEHTAVEKHEWIDGVVVEMQGGTYRNSRTNTNLIIKLGNQLDGGPCFVLESNMRLWMAAARRYTYPDTQIVCGQPQFDPADVRQTTITNPSVVFEILSDSTEANDRGPKFKGYVAMPTVQAYVLIATREPRVEWFVRHPDGTWVFRYCEGVEASFTLDNPAINIRLADLYNGVTFDPPPDPTAPRNEEPL